MTVTYNNKVFTSDGFAVLFKLLLRWRGSIYKLVWKDLLLYVVIYASLSALYRLLLNETRKLEIFKKTFLMMISHKTFPKAFLCSPAMHH